MFMLAQEGQQFQGHLNQDILNSMQVYFKVLKQLALIIPWINRMALHFFSSPFTTSVPTCN